MSTFEQKKPATVFFTFSYADNHWPDLQKLLPENPASNQRERSKKVLNNSHVVDWYFDYLLKKFLKVFFHDVLECEWRWHRYEWQMRNAIHAHGAARWKNDPGLIELTKVAYEGRLAEEKICKLRESNRPVDQLLEVAVENGKLAE